MTNPVYRIVPGSQGSESQLNGDEALIDMARMIAASQARDGAPIVKIRDGRVILRWPNGDTIHYVTEVDTSPVIRHA